MLREDLRRELWPGDTFVDYEHGINAAIRRLRDSIGDSASAPRFIETIPGVGYRFIATATFVEQGTPVSDGGDPESPATLGDAEAVGVSTRRTWPGYTRRTITLTAITGCSSGYGLATAHHFHAQGWNVIATMRIPREDVLPRSDRLRVVALDVTRPESIAAALDASGPLDVLVNNAGIGVVGAFEATPMATIREVLTSPRLGMVTCLRGVSSRA